MRYFLISLFVHVLVFSLVWVGVSVPVGKDQNSFTYLGELVAIEQDSSAGIVQKQGKSFESDILGESSPALFGPWLRMRQVEKPR